MMRQAVSVPLSSKSRQILLVLLTFICSVTTAEERWLPLKATQSLYVQAGSALDLSALGSDVEAGHYGWAQALPDGHIGFERRRQAQRFLVASVVFSPMYGGVPEHAETDALVTELRRTGYNAVRFHFVDSHLMHGATNDFEFNAQQLDRLHYFMATLKRQGIYWIVDGMTSDNAAYGNVLPNRFVKKYNTKLNILVDDASMYHWQQLVERLWGKINPYTGIATLQDPAMLGIILINEGNIGYISTISDNKYSTILINPFRKWLKNRYHNEINWQQSWANERREGEMLDTAGLPTTVRGSTPRNVDFARFVVDTEKAAVALMALHVRKLGFNGLVTAYDNWGFLNADVTRSALPWVDMHSYHTLPTLLGQPGSRIKQTSILSNSARYVRELTNARQWGKPFTVSEYGQPFWNKFRYESAALVPAIASHQEWDAICQFAEWPVWPNYDATAWRRRQAIYPYGLGGDPIARSGERLAAMLFLRGDVSPASNRVYLHVNADNVIARSAGWEQVPENLSLLAFTSAVGLDFDSIPKSYQKNKISINLTTPSTQLDKTIDLARSQILFPSLIELNGLIKETGFNKLGKASTALRSTYQSDTSQIQFDIFSRQIRIVTPRTTVVILPGGSMSAGPLSVHDADVPLLVAVSALDDQPIEKSKRLLAWVLTDAINTGMTFEDDDRTTIKALGHLPPVILAVSTTISLKHDQASRLHVWPLSLSGKRHTSLQSHILSSKNIIQWELNTAKLPDGPALFFEISTD